MKVAIYCRVSRNDLTAENQKLALVEHCRVKGWAYDIFEETESSRKTRPIKEKVLQSIRENKFDGVLVYKLDRWARSLQELIMNVTEITNRGKQFIVLTQPFDTTSSAGMLMMQILGAFAEFEREIIRERTMAGLDRARSQGRIGGRPRADNKDGYKDPKLEEVVKLVSENKTIREIAKMLNTSKNRVEKAIKKIPPLQNDIKLKEIGGLS